MKRKLTVLFVIFLGVLSLAACGSNEKVAKSKVTPEVTNQARESENPITATPTVMPEPTPSETPVMSQPSVEPIEPLISEDFMMQIDDVFSVSGRGTVATGTILSGYVSVGAEVELVGFSSETKLANVQGIEVFRKLLDTAVAGDSVGILLDSLKKADIQRGQVLAAKGYISAHDEFTAKLKFTDTQWLSKGEIEGQCYFFTTNTSGTVYCDPSTLDEEGYITARVKTLEKLPMRLGTTFELRQSGTVIASGEVTYLGTEPNEEGKNGGDNATDTQGLVKVTLIDPGTQKVNVIKEVREITGLGLKEAKELVDYTPSVIMESVSEEEAETIKSRLESLGAKVEITEI